MFLYFMIPSFYMYSSGILSLTILTLQSNVVVTIMTCSGSGTEYYKIMPHLRISCLRVMIKV